MRGGQTDVSSDEKSPYEIPGSSPSTPTHTPQSCSAKTAYREVQELSFVLGGWAEITEAER